MAFGICMYQIYMRDTCIYIYIYIFFFPQKLKEHILFLSTHGTFIKPDYDLGLTGSLNLGSVTSATWWRKMFLLLIPLFSQQIRHPSMNKSALVCLGS